MTYTQIIEAALAALKDITVTRRKRIERAITILETPADDVGAIAELQAMVTELNALVQTLQAQVSNKNQTIDELKAQAATQVVRISELESEVANLRQQLADCQEPPPPPGIFVPAGSNLQEALNDAAEGDRLNLEQGATFKGVNLSPKSGQAIAGPAFIVPSRAVTENDDGFRCKSSGVAENVTFIDLDISGFGRHGIGCYLGTTIIRGRLHHNLKDGAGGDLEGLEGPPVVIDGVQADFNGSVENLGWGAGGIKLYHTRRSEIRNCIIEDNIGNGLWWDANCGWADVINNTIVRNSRKGVFWEKSGGSHIRQVFYDGMLVVRRNTIQNNATERNGVDAGVSIISSKNVLIEDNIFGGHPTGHAGIYIREDPNRLAPLNDKPGFPVTNVTVRANTMNGDHIIGCDLPGVTCS